MSVTREPTLAAGRRFAAWLGLRIEPMVLALQPELIAAWAARHNTVCPGPALGTTGLRKRPADDGPEG